MGRWLTKKNEDQLVSESCFKHLHYLLWVVSYQLLKLSKIRPTHWLQFVLLKQRVLLDQKVREVGKDPNASVYEEHLNAQVPGVWVEVHLRLSQKTGTFQLKTLHDLEFRAVGDGKGASLFILRR
jgi:hypothetical protein